MKEERKRSCLSDFHVLLSNKKLSDKKYCRNRTLIVESFFFLMAAFALAGLFASRSRSCLLRYFPLGPVVAERVVRGRLFDLFVLLPVGTIGSTERRRVIRLSACGAGRVGRCGNEQICRHSAGVAAVVQTFETGLGGCYKLVKATEDASEKD